MPTIVAKFSIPVFKTKLSTAHAKLLTALVVLANKGTFTVTSKFEETFRNSGILFSKRSTHYEDHCAMHKLVGIFSVEATCLYCHKGYSYNLLIGDVMYCCGKRRCLLQAIIRQHVRF